MRANTIILTCALVAPFNLPTAHADDPPVHVAPDLCEEPVCSVTGDVYMDMYGQTISRFCKPKVDPPVLDHEVCCSIGTSASCKLPSSTGRCSAGMKFWCEYGELIGSAVTCYQAGTSACDLGFCDLGISSGTVLDDSSWVCCNMEVDECTYVGEGTTPPSNSCAGSIAICDWGSLNEDNTVNCDN